MIDRPTEEDLARDADRDMAACDAASPAPWVRRGWLLLSGSNPVWETRAFQRVEAGSCVFRVELSALSPDVDFSALARSALPAWIRRAEAAEARVEAAEAVLATIRSCADRSLADADVAARATAAEVLFGAMTAICDWAGEPSGVAESWRRAVKDAADRASAAEAELAKLRAMHAAACDRIAQQSDLLSRRAEKP